jgi:nucleoid-associated protein YgaU
MARGLLAVIALAAFVIGVPIALLLVAPLRPPAVLPTWDGVIDAVTRPDDGTLLLAAIQVIAWVAWAAFTVSVITELAAAARHVSTPRIPLLGGMQRLAGTLVTTAGLLLMTSTTLTATATALTQTSATSTVIHQDDAQPGTAPTPTHVSATAISSPGSSTAPAEDHPSVTVRRGDTLWDLAARHLGDGHRYTEILALNHGRPQADGRALDDTHWIYPGWQLRLPHDATALDPETPAAVPSQTSTHLVQRGDTLWDIAEDHLGDPTRYPEIVTLNHRTPQPEGATLTDPNLIRPGWTLTLPATEAATTVATPTTTPPPTVSPPMQPPDATGPEPGDDATPGGDDAAMPTDDAGSDADDAPARGDGGKPRADDAPPPTSAKEPTGIDPADDADWSPAPGTFVLGLTALAAAGVIGELARRRKLQQRARRVGQRIPLPAPGSPSHDAERTLREAAPPITISSLKQALLNLATRCYAQERDLPRVGALTLTPTDVVLHLTEDDTEPVEPFVATNAREWTAPHPALVEDPDIDDPDRPEPFPALVALGHTTDGTVLLNLEAAGTLAITAGSDTATDVLRALVAELATSDLTGRIGLIAGPEFAELADVCDAARLQIADPDAIARHIEQRGAEVTRALNSASVDDTLQARSDRAAGDIWLPVVYVTGTSTGTAAPWSGSTVVGVGTRDGAWTLALEEDRAALLPLGLYVRPQRLAPAAYQSLVSLLATAQTPDPESIAEPPSLDQEAADALGALPTSVADLPADRGELPNGPDSVRINVLGPITIEGLRPGVAEHLGRRSTELLVYLALRGKATGPELDEALWHGRRIDSQTRNSLVYRTRQRVGPGVLPVVGPDGIYRLGPTARSDWTEFRTLTHRGLSAGRAEADDLQAALNLVRDRPFLGIHDQDYTWAEHDIQHMISTIGDVAHVLARMYFESGDFRTSLEAATKGLRADPCSDTLATDALNAASEIGSPEEVARLGARLSAAALDIDPDADVPRLTIDSGRRG